MSDQNTNNIESQSNAAADRTEQLADGVLDRTSGEDYNPNSVDIVASNRARFDAMNAKIAHDHHQLESTIVPVMERVAEEAKAAAEDPAHQAMIPEQEAHQRSDPPFQRAGQERAPQLPPHLSDGAPPQGGIQDETDPDGPAVPVRNHSLRKDQ